MNRRDFIKRSLLSIGGASSLLATSSQFNLLQAVTNGLTFSDHKSLVCIFLLGGNDSLNMVIPTDTTGWNEYSATRQNLAIDQASLLSINPENWQGNPMGLHPSLGGLHELFSQGNAAIVGNVGTLIEPVTRADILAGRANLPPQLFSHSDQQNHWQTCHPQQVALTGWAGRMADMIADLQSPLSMNLSFAGNNLLQSGIQTVPYAMSENGAEQLVGIGGNGDWQQTNAGFYDRILSSASGTFARSYGQIVQRTRSTGELVNATLDAAPVLDTVFPNGSFSAQLQMVAKMIAMQPQIGHARQVYFVAMGGWDTHDNQLLNHSNLLFELSSGLSAFYRATEELGIEEQVTTFTASDFGRTLTSNGDGTDHGWAGHHFVVGGAVNGNQIYGKVPQMTLNSEDDYGDGRIIPTLSVDQYAATLASWFGLTESNIREVFPNIGNFDSLNLGFV